MIKKLIRMSGDDFTKKKYSFFFVNTFGWFLLWLFSQMAIMSASAVTIRTTISNWIAYFSGYLTTFILRYFIRKLVSKSLSEIKPWFYIFLLCIIHAHIWIAIDFVIFGLTMYDFFKLLDWFNLSYYLRTFMNDMVRLLAWSLIYFIIKMRVDWKQLSERKVKAELHAKDLEIQMLRYQLNPHFLFNSLNSIRALTLKDIQRSREMISELSEFLRYTLTSKNNSTITLKQEIEAVKHFCVIEKIRFQDKLDISFSIDPATENMLLPPLILHPLVENAIKYGMETSQAILKVEINSYKKDGQFVLEIINTGRWIDKEERMRHQVAGTNTGLENVKQILLNSYPDNHKFEIISNDGIVKIRITIEVSKER